MAERMFGNLVKGVVDLEKGILAVDGEMHADLEEYLIKQGSKSENLWGINFYPDSKGEDFLEFDSMINLKPALGNRTRGVEDPAIREKIAALVKQLVKK